MLGIVDSRDFNSVQAAINFLPTAGPNPGGLVLLPSGVIAEQLSIPSGVTLVGVGIGTARTGEQGATILDATGLDYGILSTATFGIGLRGLTVKNAGIANIKLTDVQYFNLDDISSIGTLVPTGIHVTGNSYFGMIRRPTIAGLTSGTSVGVRIDGGANENTIFDGSVKQCDTNVVIDDAVNVRVMCVDMEGGTTQTAVSLAPAGSASATIFSNRFEGLANGIVVGANGELTAIANHYGNAINGIVDNSLNHKHFIFEPSLYMAANPGIAAVFCHDAAGLGAAFGSALIKNIVGGNNLKAGSGKLLLSTAGGNPVQLDDNVPLDLNGNYLEIGEIPDVTDPTANKVRFYCRDNGAGKTQLVAHFSTGYTQVIATEP